MKLLLTILTCRNEIDERLNSLFGGFGVPNLPTRIQRQVAINSISVAAKSQKKRPQQGRRLAMAA
jgi:hypothetical protein